MTDISGADKDLWHIVARVDVCFDALRIASGDAEARILRFAHAWTSLRDLWTWDDATEAAMIGVLIGIVSDAWGGGCDVDIEHIDDDGTPMAVQVLVSRGGTFFCYPCGPTLIEALVMAIEASLADPGRRVARALILHLEPQKCGRVYRVEPIAATASDEEYGEVDAAASGVKDTSRA